MFRAKEGPEMMDSMNRFQSHAHGYIRSSALSGSAPVLVTAQIQLPCFVLHDEIQTNNVEHRRADEAGCCGARGPRVQARIQTRLPTHGGLRLCLWPSR